MLSPARFNGMLNRMGQNISWSRAHDCPCRDPNSGAARYDCPICGGKGVHWESSKTGKAAIAGQKVQENWAKFGQYENGDQVMSIPSDSILYEMGQFDRMVMLNSSAPFSIPLVHDGQDKLYFPVQKIYRVFWIDNTNSIVDGGTPSVADDGTLAWSTGEPPAGEQYTITGRKHPEYFVFTDLPQDRAHYGGLDLPRRVVARLMDNFSR